MDDIHTYIYVYMHAGHAARVHGLEVFQKCNDQQERQRAHAHLGQKQRANRHLFFLIEVRIGTLFACWSLFSQKSPTFLQKSPISTFRGSTTICKSKPFVSWIKFALERSLFVGLHLRKRALDFRKRALCLTCKFALKLSSFVCLYLRKSDSIFPQKSPIFLKRALYFWIKFALERCRKSDYVVLQKSPVSNLQIDTFFYKRALYFSKRALYLTCK